MPVATRLGPNAQGHSWGAFSPLFHYITGRTLAANGALLGGCTVTLFDTLTNLPVDIVISDASGNFSVKTPDLAKTYYITAYLAGSPSLSGSTLNTLVPDTSVDVYLDDPTKVDFILVPLGMLGGARG